MLDTEIFTTEEKIKNYIDYYGDRVMKLIQKMQNGNGKEMLYPKKIKDGIFEGPLNELYWVEGMCKQENKEVTHYYIGVCDNYEQILKEYPHIEICKDHTFFIYLTPITREEQPQEGGWRWHKWGPYIGDKNPQQEYLYDEQEIEKVYIFDVFDII